MENTCQHCNKKYKAYHKDKGKFCSAKCRKESIKKEIVEKRDILVRENIKDSGIFWKEKNKLPEMAIDYRFAIPYDINLSKNKMHCYNNGKHFKNPQTQAMQESIMWNLKKAVGKFKQDKIYVSIFVQKQYFQTDAQNFVDTICDAIQKGIGINDCWYVLERVDWEMVKRDPRIFIGIAQPETEDKKSCSCCGRILPVEAFVGIKSKSGDCIECRKIMNKRTRSSI